MENLRDEIAKAVLNGEFSPGRHLDETVLARRFEVSRTPVRDALRLLAGTGLVELRPRFGAFVRQIAPDELDMLFVAMGEVEASCARLSAIGMTPVERGALRDLHEQMGDFAQGGDRARYEGGNQDFHQLIYQGAHNIVMMKIACDMRQRLAPFRKAQFEAPGRLVRSHGEHAHIVRAILARDSSLASTTMLVHMSIVEHEFDLVELRKADAGAAKPHGAARASGRDHARPEAGETAARERD